MQGEQSLDLCGSYGSCWGRIATRCWLVIGLETVHARLHSSEDQNVRAHYTAVKGL